jgi:protein O-mannosyl-transferase
MSRPSFKTFGPHALLLVFVFLVFLPVVDCQFVSWDDDYHLYENKAIRALDAPHLKLMFLGHSKGAYLPLTFFSYALEHHFFGLEPWIYHLNNLLLHLAITALVIYLGFLLGLPLAARLAAAVVFALHPMHAESVIWVSERKDVLYTLFYLLSLVCYCHYIKKEHGRMLAFSVFFGLLSFLAKPMALSLPLVIGLFDWFFKRPLSRKLVLEKIPFFLLLPIAWISFSMIHVQMATLSWDAILVFLWVLSFYISKFLLPVGLAPLYTLPQPITLINPAYFTAVAVVAAFVASIVYFRKNRWYMFAVGYFFLSIFFLLRISSKALGPVFVADHYMYLPSLGFCFLAGWGVERCLNSQWRLVKPVTAMALVVVLVLFCVSVRHQISVWNNNHVFWEFMVKRNPRHELVYLNRGVIFVQSGRYSEALADFNRAIYLKHDYTEAFNNRGNVYAAVENNQEAVKDYTTAIELQKRQCPDGDCGRVSAVSSRIFNEVPKYRVELAQCFNNRGAAHLADADFPKAAQDLSEAIRLNPYLFEAHLNIGMVYKQLNDMPSALHNFSIAITLNRASIPAYFQRVSVYYQLRQWDKALNDLKKVLSLKPGHPDALYYRGKVEAAKGDYPAALDSLSQAAAHGYAVDERELAALRALIKK